MDNRIEKIRAEVERLKESGCESPIVICDTLLSFIDSLQEEPKPKFKVGDRICKSKIGDLKGVVINEIYSDHYMCNGACIYFTEQDDWELVEESVTKQSVEEAMQDVEEKSKAFTDAHKGESAEAILAQMRGEEPILEVLANYLDRVSKEDAMKTKDTIDRWFKEYFPEPVSENLEEIADQYSESIESNYNNGMFDKGDIMGAFEDGAQWQKKRINYPYKDNGNDINKEIETFQKFVHDNGMSPTVSLCAYHFANWQKQQMMKDAVDAKVIARWPLHSAPLYCSYEMYIPYAQHLSEGDKVKLIIIKEE